MYFVLSVFTSTPFFLVATTKAYGGTTFIKFSVYLKALLHLQMAACCWRLNTLHTSLWPPPIFRFF